MLLLYRSSKRLHFKRHLPGFTLYPLHSRYVDGDPARNPFIKRFLGFLEDPIQYQGCPFAQHMHEALCHKSDCSRESLEHSASEVAGEATLSGLVKEASTHADTHVTKGKLNLDIKRTDEEAEAGTISTKGRKQHVLDASASSKSRHFNIYPCKAYLQNMKRDFHILPEEVFVVDSRISSLSMNERRQTINDGGLEGDAKDMPRKNAGDSTEKQVFELEDNVKNLETGLHREDKELIMSHVASKLFLKDNASVLDGKNKVVNSNELPSFHHDDMALKIAPSSKKKLQCVPRSGERGYFTVLEKKKTKRKRKKKKTWDADRQLGPDNLKHLSLQQKPNQFAASGTASFVQKPRMHRRAGLPNYSNIMSIKMDSKEIKRNCSEQEVSRQVVCEERANEAVPEWKELPKDFGATGEVFSRQTSYADMEPKMRMGSHFLEMIGKGKGTCNENENENENEAFSLYQNREKLTVYDDFNINCRASHSLDACSKGWMGAQLETLEMGVRGDLRHGVGASKVHYPLENLRLKDYYLILDLNGVLIKRWGVNPPIPNVSKLNKRWIQLRPGCIEFLCKAFSKFKVGIWSTMTHKNVMGVCKLLEQQAHQPLPFFMLWSKDACYQQKGVRRPDKSHVLADFKPLSHVWHLFQPDLGSHNTVLIDDSPYKACMNSPYNCIFPDAYEGCTNDNYLNDVLWPYLEKMRMSQNLQAYIANNPLGQQPIVVGHELYYHVRGVMDVFDYHIHPTGTGELIGKV